MIFLERFGIKDLIDILLMSYLLYRLYKLMKSSGNRSIFSGVLSFIVLWFLVSYVLEMRLLGSLFDKIASVGTIVLVLLFQDEIRRFLIDIGTHRRWSSIRNFFRSSRGNEVNIDEVLPIVKASLNMSKKRLGALMVIEREVKVDPFVKAAEEIDAAVSAVLIESIFFKNSPLHDGAMVICKNRIKSAGGYLPFPHRTDIPQQFGARHRSAIGISEVTDARVVVVSEETGSISIAHKGRLFFNLSAEKLEQLLVDDQIETADSI